MTMTWQQIVHAVCDGVRVSSEALDSLPIAEREAVIAELLTQENGRRWLRGFPDLDTALADSLLAYEDDFRQKRRDRTLGRVVAAASASAIRDHARVVAGGPAATDLWSRFRDGPEALTELAEDVVGHGDRPAAEATLYLLVLDPLDPYGLGEAGRGVIARSALDSHDAHIRGLAAEFLAEHHPQTLLDALDRLAHDEDERVRGIVWTTGLRHDRVATYERAVLLIGDEGAAIPVRRSALVAIGTQMPTRDLVDILSYLVVHPDPVLAGDAASLLFSQHRNPVTADAALASPHPEVREIAERLLDPFRGSPAAGGSRPGDPTKVTDIYAGMIRQLEEREAEMRGTIEGDSNDEENRP